MKLELFVAILILSCLGLINPSYGASFNYNEYGLTLSGEIVEGDAERAVNAIIKGKVISEDFHITPSTLVLNSVGGDISESLKISSLIKSLYMRTSVTPEGKGYCASSCFFIFIAGLERQASGIDKIKREGSSGNMGTIGIHRPYFGHVTGGP